MNAKSGPERARGPSVTSRVVSVLDSFDAEHPAQTLTQLSRRAGLALTTAHRIVAELQQTTVLTRRSDGRYVIGRKLWDLGLLAPVNRELREAALPPMQDVFDATRENVHLAIRDGSSVLFVERISTRRPANIITEPGRRLPLHATGVGKVLLAYAPAAVTSRVVADLEAYTPHTLADECSLRTELTAVKSRGYAVTVQELSLGLSSVGVPVLGPSGDVVAALGLVVPGVRGDMARLAPVLQVAARAITRQLSPYR